MGYFIGHGQGSLTKCATILHHLVQLLRFIHKSDASFYYNIHHIVAITYLHVCTYEYMHML